MQPAEFAARLRAVRSAAPLVQCITNFVTVNDCANMILAAGPGHGGRRMNRLHRNFLLPYRV